MGTSIVFANQKGGVGKTTTAVNLGAYLAKMGNQVLLVDFDSQGNLSSSVGADKSKQGIYEAMTGNAEIESIIQRTPLVNLSIVPSNINLTGAGVEFVNEENREHFLEKTLAGIKSSWDYIFIDCPPSLGILTLNGLTAADEIIIPLQCEYYALEGLNLLLQTIQMVKQSLNPSLKVCGILFTMYDSRTKLANEVVHEVTGYFKDKVFRTVIPRNVKLSEAPSHGLPISEYDAECIGALSYEALAKEVMARA
ncbi:MAG: ParA family protein [Spirochaetales bacterium]|jgi:chromosome partitioning protein|nr:ParA family protein [Spirochaetales bacterium]